METKNNKYRECIRINGKKINSPWFKKKTDAREWKAKLQSDRQKSKLHGIDYKPITTQNLEDYSTDWLENYIRHTKATSTYNNYKRALYHHISPLLGKLKLAEIVLTHCEQLVQKLKVNGNNAKGINDIVKVLKQLLNEAQQRGDIHKNPLIAYKMLKVEPKDVVFWEDSEIRKFLVTARPNKLYQFFVTALYTGMRKGEIAGLKWDSVNFERNQITVKAIYDRNGLRATTKTNRIRYVPMNNFLKETLLSMYHQRKENQQFVFVDENEELIDTNHVYRIFHKLQAKAGLTESQRIRFHDLRHTFASQFMMKGLGTIYELCNILGHTDVKMTSRYAHLSPKYMASITEKLSYDGVENELISQVPLKRPQDCIGQKNNVQLLPVTA